LRHGCQRLSQAAVFEVYDETIGASQGEDTVLNGLAQVEHDACFVIF